MTNRRIAIIIDDDLIRRLDEMAQKERRSRSNMLTVIIEGALNETKAINRLAGKGE